VLFRQEEADMRRKLIEADVIECVLGLGPNLFYNSPMEACVVICRTAKAKERRNKILFINAVNEVTRERAQSFLTDDHIARIVKAYEAFADEPSFTRVVGLEEIRKREFNINIPLYVTNTEHRRTAIRTTDGSLDGAFSAWLTGVGDLREALSGILSKGTSAEPLPTTHDMVLCEPLWLDRSKWQTFRFDQIAENIRESVIPTPDDSATYIGLEHMDTDLLHVRRWGSEADLIGQKLRMRKGDILFARRNAYLRRVAIAPHDGLFSAHGMILRAKPEVVLPEFLPFLMISNRFMKRAVGISVGSLSPTINWTTLKLEEFALPPLDQQCHIAETLWAVDEALAADNRALESAEQFRIAKLFELYQNGIGHHEFIISPLGRRPKAWEVAPLSKYYDVQLGKMMSPKALNGASQRPYLRNANVQWNRLDLADVATMDFNEREAQKFELRNGDILACEGRHVGKSALWRDEIPGACYQKALHRIRARSEEQLPEFLLFQMEYHSRSGIFADQVGATTMPHLPAERLREIAFAFPPRTEQAAIVEEIEAAIKRTKALQSQVENGRRLLAEFTNLIVGNP
jgi:restriction endonuclease S subunit